MGKRRCGHSKMFKKAFAYLMAFAMIVGLMPVTVAKAEETDIESYETGLYFAGWQWIERELSWLSESWYTELPDNSSFALIYAKAGEEGTTYQSVNMDDVTVTYCDGLNDEDPSSLEFGELEEGQQKKIKPEDWEPTEISGGTFIPDKTIPLTYHNFNQTGTYKFTYTVDGEEYSCYLYMAHRPWDFYEGNEVTDNPLREYYYQEISGDTGFYLVQADENVNLGKLEYDEDGAVKVGEDGKPVLAESGPVVAAKYEWDDELQQDKIIEDYSDCISYNSETGKISIQNNPKDNATEYTVRVYFYVSETYEESETTVTNYRQESTDIQVHHGEDLRNSIWVGYDESNGAVAWKLQEAEGEPTPMTAYRDIVGDIGGTYDIYLTEKPAYPENFDWDHATEEQDSKYGWRAGAEPVVTVYADDGTTYEYRVDAEDAAFRIDDCGDGDNTTWHFTYNYQAYDSMNIFWSDYDAFSYNDTEQFQIEMGCQSEENGGVINLTPTPSEEECYVDEAYGEKYNFAINQIGKVSVTFTPNNGNALDQVRIGDVWYVNEAFKGEEDSRPTFTTAEDGSWTHTFSKEELKAYYWENDEKVMDTDEDGNPKYACVYVEAWFRWQDQDGFSQGFSWNVFPETEGLAGEGIESVSYKVNDETEWTTLSGQDIGDLYFAQGLGDDETITVKFTMRDGYTISATNFGIEYQTDQGDHADYRPVNEGETTEDMIAALIGENGYTFTFTPKESSADADGNPTIQTEDAALRLQFNVIRTFDETCNINIFVQREAGKTEDGTIIYGEMDDDGNYIEATQRNAEIAFYFNENPYGGQGVLREEVENNGENPLTIQYISTIPDTSREMVKVTPETYFNFSAGGYTTGETENEIVIEDDLIDELYIDYDGDNAFEVTETENELISPDTDENGEEIPGRYTIPLEAAEKYSIFIRKHESQVATLSWNYIKDEGNPEQDDLVEHGKVYVKEIKRGDTIILGEIDLDQNGNVVLNEEGLPNYGIVEEGKLPNGLSGLSQTGGTIWAENGDEVTLLLVPTYGYQLGSANINGQQAAPQEEVSTFKITLEGNLHFGGVFVKSDDKTDVTQAEGVSAVTIANGENAAASGNLSLTVADNASYTTDVTASVQTGANETVEKVASLDLTLENIVSKGAENDYWRNNVTSFENDITVGLKLDDVTLAEGESLTVVRDHEGTLTELDTVYNAATKTMSFHTNQFSTYTIVKKFAKQEPEKPNTTPEEHKHSLQKTDAKAATCTAAGNKEYWTCSTCGKVYSDAEGKTETTAAAMTIPAIGHNWDNGTVTKEATATEAGVKTYHCTNAGCTETKTEAISATGVPTKGTVIRDEKGTASYKVTDNDTKSPTVTYTGTKDSKAKTVTVPATVTVDGVTYKVTAVADNAFKGNKTVTKVTIPKNVTTIGKNAFSGCTKLKTVIVGSDVTTVGANAFKDCKALTKVTLPSKTTTIGANAFDGCKKLNTITIKSKKMTSKTIAKNAFKGVSKNTTIKVPSGKAKTYKTLFQKKGLSKKVNVK